MSFRSEIIKAFKSSDKSTKLMIITGLATTLFLIFLLAFSWYIVPYPPNKLGVGESLSPPSWDHPMGTDRLGRDMLSRVIAGTRWSLGIALISVSLSLVIGSFLGAVSGYMGGMIDTILSLAMDALWVFPTFVLALVVALVLGPGLVNTSLAIGIVAFPVYYRVIRSLTVSLKERSFIKAERLINAKPFYIIRRHLFPFYVSSILVLSSLRLARAILAVSGLGFLGLGVPPPTPEWGTELATGRFEMLGGAWWLTVFPGLMILVSILGFNLLGEGLDYMIEPITRRGE